MRLRRDPLAGLPRGNEIVLRERNDSDRRAVAEFVATAERMIESRHIRVVRAISRLLHPPRWTWPSTSFPARPATAVAPAPFVGLAAALSGPMP